MLGWCIRIAVRLASHPTSFLNLAVQVSTISKSGLVRRVNNGLCM